ncbi:adenylate isopentenyltransferase-like [Rutidosis leptorrhynchoides]|uniref:adenylate isopentenyltransferase-like n=1 Tax=Rutidosis leptorrhynchoides TaxID=125765 RepID=UPI003A9970AA
MEPTNITAVTNTISPTISPTTNRRRRSKIVVIMGSTGSGKSRLAIDLSKRLPINCEIINSDKMQVYSGLDITTNKVTLQDQLNVPHHLIGSVDPTRDVFTLNDFRKLGSDIINDVKSRRGLPIVAGGSNSLVYSLVVKKFDPKSDVFNGPEPEPISTELRYDCCFIWIDVSLPILNQYLSNRVDDMMETGMFEELGEYFRSGDYEKVGRTGLGESIGIPEFENYFNKYPPGLRTGEGSDSEEEYDEAVKRIKDNTCQLAKKQVSKILRLRDAGWDVNRIDATEAFKAVLTAEYGGAKVAEIWEKQVVEPSMKIVKHFLDE